jgi:hypothetical protein
MSRRAPHAFEAVAETLALFDGDRGRAQQCVRDRLGTRAEPGVITAGASCAPAARRPVGAASFDDLLRDVCVRFGVTAEALRSRLRGRRLAAARSALAARAAAELGLSGAEIGRRLGVTKAAVHLMLERARTPTT